MAKQTAIVMGTNVVGTIEGEELVLRIKLDEENGMSSSGKTIVVGSTHGTFRSIPGKAGLMVSVNVNKKPE